MSSSVNQELVNLLQNGKHIIVTSTGQSAGANNGKTTIHPDGIIVSTGIQGISGLGGPLILLTPTKDPPASRTTDVSLTGSATAAGITDTQAVFKIPETSPAPTKTSVAISQQNGQFVAPPGCIGILMPNGSIHNSSLTLVTPQGTGVTQNANSGIQMILTDSPNAGKTTSTLFQSSELPTFSNYLTQTTNTCTSESEGAEKHSMLHTLLTTGTCPMEPLLIRRSSATGPISPDTVDTHSELSSPLGQPTSIFDSNTQQTLICKSENLNLGQSDGQEDDVNDIKWDVIDSEEPNKALKSHRNSDAPSSILEQETMEKLFDAGSAVSTSEFTFTKFGADVPGLFTFGENKKPDVCTSTNTVGTVSSSVIVPHEMEEDMFEVPVKTHTRSQSTKHKVKEPSLNQQFPVRVPGYELQILEQPEEQHRARYLTEGSRGAVKNRAGDGYALVQLSGDVDYATLQVFVGNDTGRVKPHGFYQACKVSGKNSTPCKEKEVDGTMVIEMELSAMNDMKASIDNVGILKLRNADVEQRIGIAKAKKKSTKARMIFRVIFQKADGNLQTLQIASSPILCTQPIGQPEMCKISMDSCSAEGGLELFIIGKNFLKGTKVIFQEVDQEDEKTVIWRKDSEIDKDYFQPTHLICTVPPYQDPNIESNKKVQLITNSGGKMSDPLSFTYIPVKKNVKKEVPMETDQSEKRPVTVNVSPEALELNSQIQQTQQQNSSSNGMFQLPPGTLNIAQEDTPPTGESKMQVDTTPAQESFTAEAYGEVELRQATKRPLEQAMHDVQASRTMLEELTQAEKRPNQMDQGTTSPDILDNIIQEVKQDHPEHNFDKMAEAILREGWHATENTQGQFKQPSQIPYQSQIESNVHSTLNTPPETQMYNNETTNQQVGLPTTPSKDQQIFHSPNVQDSATQPKSGSATIYNSPSNAGILTSGIPQSPPNQQIYQSQSPGSHGNLTSPRTPHQYHSPAVNEISSNHQLTSNHQIYNSTNTGVQGSALQQGATDQKVFHPSSPLDSASVNQTSINANTQQVHFQDTTSAYSDNGVNLSQLLNDGNTDQIQSFTGNNTQYQPNTNTQYQSNTSQQYQANTSQQFQLNNQMNNAQQYQSNATEQYQSNANQQFQTNAGQQFQTNTNQQYQANTSQQFQANTGTQFSLNSTQQYQEGQTTQPQYPEGGSTGGTQLSGLQSQQLPMIQQGQSSTQQFTPELISDYNNHVSPNVTAPEGMHSVSSQQNMAFNTETKLDVMEQKTSGFQINDQSLSFQTTSGVANCHPPSVQFHISDNPGPSTAFPTLSQTSETTQQSNQFDNDVKMYQQASPLQTTNSQNNYQQQQQQQQQQQLQQQSSALPNHPKFEAAPEAQMLAAQFIQNATKGTETLVNQPQTTMVHSNLLQSNTTQSQPDGYHSNSPANQQSLQSLISELTSQNGLTTPLTNATSPQQQFPNTPSQPSAPQIIICNPPGNSGNSGQQAPPPTSVPSSTGMPSIVILPGGGNSTTQVESLLRSILGSLNQQQNS